MDTLAKLPSWSSMRRRAAPRRLVAALVVAWGCLVVNSSAHATVVDQGRFSRFEVFPEMIITDLPCLEGTEFVATGTESVRGQFVDSAEGFHFQQTEKHTGQLVPVDDGLTYVEKGNVEKIVFNGPPLGGGGVINLTLVNNDAFVVIEDGHIVAQATIRIHELQHLTGVDTDGDGLADRVRVDFSKTRLSCPDMN
jgi:hypothetical protein